MSAGWTAVDAASLGSGLFAVKIFDVLRYPSEIRGLAKVLKISKRQPAEESATYPFFVTTV